ncbi:class I SAM-dependent methyltransferase [Mailhella sp.]
MTEHVTLHALSFFYGEVTLKEVLFHIELRESAMKEEAKLTLEYYEENAQSFCLDTQDVDFSIFQLEFMKGLPQGGRILDLGCGSGRDSKAFMKAGYHVTAVDGSFELSRKASAFIGQPVICATFQEYIPAGNFDGIWACASLLHLSAEELAEIISRMAGSLNQGGIFYVSFKYGEFRGMRKGRFFQDMTEASLKELLQKIPELEILSMKVTSDVRAGREKEKWLNVFLRKVERASLQH